MIFSRVRNAAGDSFRRIVDRLFYTSMGAYVVSAIFGLALAFMFQRVCADKSCIVVKPPPMKEIDDYVYKINDTSCYKYTPRVVKCA